MNKNIMKITRVLLLSLSTLSLVGYTDITGGDIGSNYTKTDDNNFRLDLNFKLDFDVNIFQFQGKELSSAQKRINKDILDFANSKYELYKQNFSSFIEVLSECTWNSWGCENELKIAYELHSNTEDIFSIMMFSRETGGGGNGCRGIVKGFNYILGGSWVSNLTLSDILIDDYAYFGLLEKINTKLSQRDTPLKARLTHIINSAEFAFAKDELIISFQAYTVGCGADCIVEIHLKYEEIKDLLSPNIIKALNLPLYI